MSKKVKAPYTYSKQKPTKNKKIPCKSFVVCCLPVSVFLYCYMKKPTHLYKMQLPARGYINVYP